MKIEKLDLYEIDTGWACAGVLVNEQGIVVQVAPIFKKFKGVWIKTLEKAYKVTKITNEKK